MTYKENLLKAKAANIDIYKLHIADEVEAIFGEDVPNYEKICEIMSELYLNTYHLSCETLGNALRYATEKDNIKLEQIHKGTEQFDLIIELACSMD